MPFSLKQIENKMDISSCVVGSTFSKPHNVHLQYSHSVFFHWSGTAKGFIALKRNGPKIKCIERHSHSNIILRIWLTCSKPNIY